LQRWKLSLNDIPPNILDAIDAVERNQARTVIFREKQPIAALVSSADLDRVDPPDPGAHGDDPLIDLCGSCDQDAFVEAVLQAAGVGGAKGTDIPGSQEKP
jgi:hypothetical protein